RIGFCFAAFVVPTVIFNIRLIRYRTLNECGKAVLAELRLSENTLVINLLRIVVTYPVFFIGWVEKCRPGTEFIGLGNDIISIATISVGSIPALQAHEVDQLLEVVALVEAQVGSHIEGKIPLGI